LRLSMKGPQSPRLLPADPWQGGAEPGETPGEGFRCRRWHSRQEELVRRCLHGQPDDPPFLFDSHPQIVQPLRARGRHARSVDGDHARAEGVSVKVRAGLLAKKPSVVEAAHLHQGTGLANRISPGPGGCRRGAGRSRPRGDARRPARVPQRRSQAQSGSPPPNRFVGSHRHCHLAVASSTTPTWGGMARAASANEASRRATTWNRYGATERPSATIRPASRGRGRGEKVCP